MLRTGYLCGRCEKYELRLYRVISVEQSGPGEIIIKHTCLCLDGVPLKGRYVLVPDLIYKLFRNRMVRLPYYATTIKGPYVPPDHPDLTEMRDRLADVHSLEDMFPAED